MNEVTKQDIAKNESYRDKQLAAMEKATGRRFKVQVDFPAFVAATKDESKIGSYVYGYILEGIVEHVVRVCRNEKLKQAFNGLTGAGILRYEIGAEGAADGSCKQPRFEAGALVITISPDEYFTAHNYVCKQLETAILAAQVHAPAAAGTAGTSTQPTTTTNTTKGPSAIAIPPGRQLYLLLNVQENMSPIDTNLLKSTITMPGFPINTPVYDGNEPSTIGNSALHIACRAKASRVVQILVEAGADVNCKNAEGCTPLHEVVEIGAAYSREYLNQGPACIAMLAKGSKGRLNPNIQDGKGWTPVQLAIIRTHWDLLTALFTHCSNIDLSIRNGGDNDALTLAIESGEDAIIKMVENYRPAGAAPAKTAAAAAPAVTAKGGAQELTEIVTLLTKLADVTAAETRNGEAQAELRKLSHALKKKYGLF